MACVRDPVPCRFSFDSACTNFYGVEEQKDRLLRMRSAQERAARATDDERREIEEIQTEEKKSVRTSDTYQSASDKASERERERESGAAGLLSLVKKRRR